MKGGVTPEARVAMVRDLDFGYGGHLQPAGKWSLPTNVSREVHLDGTAAAQGVRLMRDIDHFCDPETADCFLARACFPE